MNEFLDQIERDLNNANVLVRIVFALSTVLFVMAMLVLLIVIGIKMFGDIGITLAMMVPFIVTVVIYLLTRRSK